MAITSSAKKALRGSKRKAAYNAIHKDAIKHITKAIKKLVAEKRFDDAQKLVPQAQKAIDKAAKTNFIKKNTAARRKSNLVAFIRRAQVKPVTSPDSVEAK
jgi:ribosomal protein S20